jgi:hypothetical protein
MECKHGGILTFYEKIKWKTENVSLGDFP